MPRTSQCKSCGAVLNLPEQAKAGKRLRCPKCGLKFVLTESDAASASTVAAPLDAEPGVSGHEIDKRSLRDDLPLPTADRDLRETFELPLASGREAERHGAAAAAVGDAAALFRDSGSTRRHKSAADSRAHARRCSHCGGLVPQGMSICVTCGTDQETGTRVGFDDDFAPAAPPPPPGPPLHVAVVGGLLGTGALILLILSLINSVGDAQSWEKYGWLCLALVSGFGIFAVVQFIRLKTAKLLMVALTLGVVVNLLALVFMPLVLANLQGPDRVIANVHSDNPDDAGVTIRSPEELIDTRRIYLGITFLVVYAVLALYLMSPTVKKPFARANLTGF